MAAKQHTHSNGFTAGPVAEYVSRTDARAAEDLAGELADYEERMQTRERQLEARTLVQEIEVKQAVVGRFLTNATGEEFPPDAIQYPKQIAEAKERIKDLTGEPYSEVAKRVTSEKIVSELNEYVKMQGPLPYAQAESEMARSLARQLTSGAKQINLSQRYATADQTAASDRHQKALYNLMPLIREAARNGYQVDYGQAIAQGMKQKEVLAISNGFKLSSGV